MTPDAKLQKLQDLLKLVDESISRSEFETAFKEVVDFVKRAESRFASEIATNLTESDRKVMAFMASARADLEQTLQETRDSNATTLATLRKRALESIDALFTRMRLSERFDSLVGDFNDKFENKIEELNQKIASVPTIESIIAQIPEDPEETAEEVRDKLESLKDEARLDSSAIKGLDTLVKETKTVISGGLTRMKTDSLYTKYHGGASNITISTTAPSNPQLYDLWLDIS